MKPNYSRILITDWVLANQGSPLYPATMDINMMALFSSMERSDRQWKELLSNVGLRIVKIHGIGEEMESLIEVVRE